MTQGDPRCVLGGRKKPVMSRKSESDWNRWRIGRAASRFWRGERGWYWHVRRG